MPSPNSIKKVLHLTLILCLAVTTSCSSQDREHAGRPDQKHSAAPDTTGENAYRVLTATGNSPDDPKRSALSVDTILEGMSLREKIGQLFFVRAEGYFQNEESEAFRELAKQVEEFNIGGIIFFKGTVYGQAVLTNKLQRHSRIPLWITQDMEFGAAMRVEGTTRITPAMGIAATGDPNNAYWSGMITAREAGALGVNQIFAPVLDVNNNPQNPVINVRSFSGDPQIVARYGTRFIEGVSSEGIIATGKHFPGHGDTDTDSHYALPVIQADYARLDSVELVPFRAAINHNVGSIMSAHINFPSISTYSGRPSTLDQSILDRILVDSLGFDGMIVTDGLEMRGISSYYSPGEAARLALQAGADIMLLSPDALTAINELEQAVKSGRLSEQTIDTSVRKLLRWKKEAGLFRNPMVSIERLSERISSPRNKLLADKIARESVSLLKNKGDIIPISRRRFPRILVLSIANDNSGETGQYLANQMRRYHPGVRFEVFDRRSGDEERRSILRDARWADLIVIGSYVPVNSRGDRQFDDRQQALLDTLPAQTPKALLTLGNPYVVRDLKNAEVHLLVWDDSEQQIQNTVPALFGRSAIMGTLPIEIPGMYALGHGLKQPRATECYDAPGIAGFSADSLHKVEQIMRDAVDDSTFPGAVVGVVKDGVLAYCNAVGYHTYDKRKPVAPNDVYDLASLTKVVATTASVMNLVDEGKLRLEDSVSKYIPEFRTENKEDITIRQLLLHTSGLPAFRLYIDELQSRDQILQAVRSEPLIREPGAEYEYSDLGFILLGEIIEKVSSQQLDHYARQTFYEPLGMESTWFNPKSAGPWMAERIPPTEIDSIYRNKTIQAEAHDERAWYMAGVAGHAGLFSNVQDLSIFARMLLNNGTYAGKQYLSPDVIHTFIRKQSELHNRGLGFDRKSVSGFSTAGTLTGKRTYGHLGFTGTSLWIDPDRDLAIILLANRTYPHRSYGDNISQVRSDVADAVISSLTNE